MSEGNVEAALRAALDCKGSYGGTVSERGGDPALCTKCEALVQVALAALRSRGSTEGCERHKGDPHNLCEACWATERGSTDTRLTEALRAVSWFYYDHVIEGDPPCPCKGCEQARLVFTAALATARADAEESR